jgi:protein SCO1/2
MGVWAMVLLIGCAQPRFLPYYNSAELTPEWRAPSHRIGEFDLIDQVGRRVTATDVAGKVYVASFFFTSCKELCPKLRTNLTRVQQTFASDGRVLILSHAVVPEADSVSVLARYARVNHIRPDKWLLLRGDRAQVKHLAQAAYFVDLDDRTGLATDNLMHTEVLVLVDGAGHIRGVYDGTLAYEVSRLIDDMRTLLEG